MAFAIYLTLWRIDIFTNVLVLFSIQDSAAKSHNTPGNSVHRKNDATMISIEQVSIFCLITQSRFKQVFFTKTMCHGSVSKGVPLF